MGNTAEHIDKPEPRAQAVLAFLAICAIYLALPRDLVIGPIWLLPTVIVVLLVPTVVSHRVGRRSLNRTLGLIINGITTLALIGSVILLVRFLPTHRESPLQLLRSGGLLWLTNVIVFALWYWRLDGGGPTLRHEQKNSAALAFFSRRCRSRMTSVANLHVCAGGRASLIICSSPSRRVLHLARPTRRCWRAGRKFSR